MDTKKHIDEFVKRWTGRGDEKQETQSFWIDLLHSVFGYDDPTQIVQFEKRVKLENSTKFIDAYIPQTKVIVEQKSSDVDLSKEALQSGGEMMTPFYQAKRYNDYLPADEKARWIVCCNFSRFEIHDMNRPLDEPEVILLSNLEKDYVKLGFLKDIRVKSIRKEEEISFKAGKLVGEIYDAILPQYKEPGNPSTLKSLNQLCVRLVFCLYAEDSGLFGEKDKFYNYLKDFNPSQFRKALIGLFDVFDTPYEERDEYLEPELASFPYIRGGIFSDKIEIPLFTSEIIGLILEKASLGVDWSDISPTIFGAVFESTLNPQTRRNGGMHYTSVENIHRVIDPLFLDTLKTELESILNIPVKKKRDSALSAFQDKLASLKFLDQACGSGNFLTETYLSLRRLENLVLENMGVEGMLYLGEEFSPIKVKIDQFYGIEINDFAVAVARTALWIAEAQMMKETEHIVGRSIEYFPLKENPNIVEGNALRMDWNEVLPAAELNYIMGNPPFVGAMMMDKGQREDLLNIFGAKYKGVGELDYVCGWYRKAADYMSASNVSAAFVSTNSITQGQQVAMLWKPLTEMGISINFAWRTFIWDSQASAKAHVHCVIIGFSYKEQTASTIYSEHGKVEVPSINPYLVNAGTVFIENRSVPLCSVPPIKFGNMPRDGGGFIFTEEERNNLLIKEPLAEKWLHLYLGAEEFLKGKKRYCLWLVGANPSELKKCPTVMERIEKVRNFRASSIAAATRKFAETPTLFCQIAQPDTSYIAVPKVSSERRRYIPMGFMDKEIICSDLLFMIPDAEIYHFGILESNVHMAWMRTVCGRMKSDYRYSKDIVYNNFPWPSPTIEQKKRIETTANCILEARGLYSDSPLADIYDELTMPPELRKAHQANDKAVMEAYGFSPDMTEEKIVAALFKLYSEIVDRIR